MVFRGHYSSFNQPYPSNTQQIIFIKHNPRFDFVLLNNMFYRCHGDSVNAADFNADIIQSLQTSMLSSTGTTDRDYRNNWYTKLTERHFELAETGPTVDLPVFNFDYASFFDLKLFLLELRKTANFVNNTFSFDQSLVVLWHDFMTRNQGYHAQQHANNLIDSVYNNRSANIEADWKIQAYINAVISKTFNLYDGPLFEDNIYPTDTQQIADIIMNHIKTFDQRF
jgi:hypothetical protein